MAHRTGPSPRLNLSRYLPLPQDGATHHVELGPYELQVRYQAIDLGIADITPVDECQKPQQREPWYDMDVKFARDGSVECRVDVDEF